MTVDVLVFDFANIRVLERQAKKMDREGAGQKKKLASGGMSEWQKKE